MVRPTTISNDAILEAARALFVEKGPRATTAEIAERAGVSEGILFKRFGNKGALMKAAMPSREVGVWIQQQMREQAPLRTQQDFARFIRWHTKTLRDVVPMVVMAWSSRAQKDVLPVDLTGPTTRAPFASIRTLTEMLEKEMDAGHLARRNAEAVARILIGSIWYFVFLGLVRDKAPSELDEDTFLEELARVVFGDVDPARKRHGKRRARR
jgi:AcrR family transcriptional regulator